MTNKKWKTSAVLLFWAALFVLTLLATLFYPPDFDAYWHLRHGLNILDSNIWPSTDVLSFTFAGREVSYSSPLFGLTLGLMTKIFGNPLLAFTIYRVACFAAIYLLILRCISKYKPHWFLAIFCISLMAVFTANTLSSRAELLSMALNSWVFYFLLNQKKLTNTVAISLILLMVIWSNWHITAALGFVTIGAFYIQQVYTNRTKPKESQRIVIFGVMTFLAGFCVANFSHPLLSILVGFEDFSIFVPETRALTYWGSNHAAHSVLFVGLLALVLAINQRNIMISLVLSSVLLQTLSHEKLFLHLIPLIIVTLTFFNKEILKYCAFPRFGKYFIILAIGILCFNFFDIAKNIGALTKRVPLGYLSANYEHALIPYELDDYIKEKQLKGNVLNSYVAGGYLSYKHWPNLKVFIDGRVNILYDRDFAQKYFAASHHPTRFIELFHTYPFDYVISDMIAPYGLNEWAIRAGGFNIEHMTKHHVLLTPKLGRFPISTQLFVSPSCLDKFNSPDLEGELHYAQKNLPADSQLRKFLEFGVGFLKSTDKKTYLQSFRNETDTNQRWANRSAAAMAFNQEIPELGVELLMLQTFGLRFSELRTLIAGDCFKNNCNNAADLFTHFKITKIPQSEMASMEVLANTIITKYPDLRDHISDSINRNIADYADVNTETCETIIEDTRKSLNQNR